MFWLIIMRPDKSLFVKQINIQKSETDFPQQQQSHYYVQSNLKVHYLMNYMILRRKKIEIFEDSKYRAKNT